MSILTFDPANRFYDKIQQGIKIGTIRDKPKKVGETLHLWEKKRGMRGDYYCGFCLSPMPCQKCGNYDGKSVWLPRKIAEKKCTACIELDMKVGWNVLSIVSPQEIIINSFMTELHPFTHGEGFNSNRGMVEWFRKHLKEGVWEKRYWIRWD